ncbi:hypothetical protein L1049_023699 [Liquidambar formosana]|uniref:Uncharacterized protein n=1 Tax=Liquidambar formosana TaxID=63359 RepID=A0AAP0RZY8_LIQFO
MAMSRSWFGVVRKKLFRSSSPHTSTIIVRHTNATSTSLSKELTLKESEEITSLKDGNGPNEGTSSSKRKDLWKQEIAAIKIQAIFRSHLARRAYRALKSLVKLQAVVRGVLVRRQARIALHCMHALVRLQVTVRTRQLLTRCSDD